MKNLKIKYVYNISIVILLLLDVYRYITFNKNYKNLNDYGQSNGLIINKIVNNNLAILTIKGKYNFKAYSKNLSLSIGDKISFEYEKINTNEYRFPNSFNYDMFLKGKYIHKRVNISNEKIVSHLKIYFFKEKLMKIIDGRKSKKYLYTFLFADKTYLEDDIKESFSYNGVIHLICISGFHITFCLDIIKRFTSKLFSSTIINIIILLFFSMTYLELSSFSIPLLRAVFFYFFSYFSMLFNIKVSKKIIYFITLEFVIFINPGCIYLSGFWYSFLISYFILFSKVKNKNLFSINIISFISALPLIVYFNYKVNFLSVIYSLLYFYVICYLIYPLSFFSLFSNFFDTILSKLLKVTELTLLKLSEIRFLTLYISKLSLVIVIIIYIILLLIFNKFKFKYLFLLLILFLYSYIKPNIDNNSYIYFLDVGQGDSILMVSKKHKIVTLIDTGGVYNNEEYITRKMINSFYSIGVNKINQLIITHGDYDHMGEAINLVENFKVEKVIFNCGPYDDLEKELIRVLDKKKIKYYSCIEELNIDNNKLYFLQTKEYDNENDNSNVIYTELNGYKFMFMGDAGVDKEKDILEKYNISDVDVLKVGHHGSKTSSSKEFISEITPKYSIISVGKNNRYGHPNKEVLDLLYKSKIYRTDKDGSIIFKIKNSRLLIKKYGT